MKRKFIDEFTINEEKLEHEDIKDYNAFPDKELLEKLRNEIIQNLIDNNNIKVNVSGFCNFQVLIWYVCTNGLHSH